MPRTVSIVHATLFLLAAFFLLSDGARAEDPTADDKREFFESRIRPVLVEHCYQCHNSAETAEGELALDHRAGLLAGGVSGPTVVPGKPGESRLLGVLRHEIEGQEMPDGGPKLDARTIADFDKWIALGAPDPRDEPPTADELAQANDWAAVFERRKKWWSFQPIRRPPVPQVEDDGWSARPIDRFVLAKLEDNGLLAAAPADAVTLVRRLYFVLIGLPPTPEEVARWTQRIARQGELSPDADAVAELVDHLLASPRFGERWARHWMDWIRYAESHGSEGDPPIDGAWRYRDYLIRALNADVPYDQLVREHIAGDLLASPRANAELGINESIIATAHWRMVFHGFAPTDALDEKVRFVDDQINAFSKAFLGLTVSCARCHDHKFDPISQRDYYALFGILGSCRPGRATIDLPEVLDRNRGELAALKPKLRAALADDWRDAAARVAEQLLRDDGPWTKADKPSALLHTWFLMRRETSAGESFAQAWQRRVDDWRSDADGRAEHEQRQSVRRWRLADRADYALWFRHGTGLPEEPLPAGEFAVAPEGDSALTGIYPAGVVSHCYSSKHAARLTSPDIHLDDDCELWLRVIGQGGSTVRYAVQDYPRSGTVYPVTDLPSEWRWQRYDLAYWTGDDIHLELSAAQDAPLLVKRTPRSWFGIREALLVRKGQSGPPTDSQEHLDPLLAACGASSSPAEQSPENTSATKHAPATFQQLAERYVRALTTAIDAWRDGRASDSQAVFLDRCLRQGLLPNRLDALPKSKPLLEETRRLEAEIPVPRRVPSLDESSGRIQRLFVRGNHKAPADEVPRRFLEAIDPTPYETSSSGRLELSEALLHDNNPLTRRVIVNRVWNHLFGRGLVASPDNFGRMGVLPTHPELLDHLAVRFADPRRNDGTTRSPGGLGWSLKGLIREIVTSKVWQLSTQPSRAASQVDPDNRLLSHANLRRLEAEAIRDSLLAVSGRLDVAMFGVPVDGKEPRRSVYVRVRRNALDPFLRVFDFPEPLSAVGRRDITNVPAQSLAMMNDPQVDGYAGAWAARVLSDATLSSDQERIDSMFRTAYSRRATAEEVADIAAYLSNLTERGTALVQQAVTLRQQIAGHRADAQAILQPTRKRLVGKAQASDTKDSLPRPIARWEFDEDFRDTIGAAHGSARGNVRVVDGSLVADGQQAHAVTVPLERTLRAKTLEAWVQLDTLEQRGGGVISVQTPDGVTFDAIVFGEKDPRQWLAGSNNFARTQSFRASPESDAATRPVHVAIAYHADGRIVGYRDGQPYGKAYQSTPPVEFKAGSAVVGFGVRHLPAVGNRMLAGRILCAQLYDRALSDEEIRATSRSAGHFVPESAVLAALTPEQRASVQRHRIAATDLESELKSLGPVPAEVTQQVVWKDLARALLCFKELIYIK